MVVRAADADAGVAALAIESLGNEIRRVAAGGGLDECLYLPLLSGGTRQGSGSATMPLCGPSRCRRCRRALSSGQQSGLSTAACPGCHATLHVTAACSCLHYCLERLLLECMAPTLLFAALSGQPLPTDQTHCSPVFTRCSALCLTLRRTATSSMTSVPKPLKFLRPHYDTLKARLEGLAAGAPNRQQLADVVSGGWWGRRAQVWMVGWGLSRQQRVGVVGGGCWGFPERIVRHAVLLDRAACGCGQLLLCD